MLLAGRMLIYQFCRTYPTAKRRLDAWSLEVSAASWTTPQDIRNRYASASFIGNNRVVFEIGNRFRLGVWVDYEAGVVDVRKVGTHEEYNRWGTSW